MYCIVYKYLLTPYCTPGTGICWTRSLGFNATVLQRWLRLDLEPKAEDQILFRLKQENPHGLPSLRRSQLCACWQWPNQRLSHTFASQSENSWPTRHSHHLHITSQNPTLRGKKSLPNWTWTKSCLNFLLSLYKTILSNPFVSLAEGVK